MSEITSEKANEVKVSKDYDKSVNFLMKNLAVEKNFDIIYREMEFAGKKFGMFFVDGFVKDNIVTLITRSLEHVSRNDISPFSLEKLIQRHLHYVEVETEEKMDKIMYSVLSGAMAVVVEGTDKVLIIDVREYPVRGPDEPDLERVIRGARDGFVETIIFNTALIRRRIRDPRLRVEILQAGRRSQTDICILYIEDIANLDIVESIKEKIEIIDIDGLPMAEKSVEELITPGSYWNPFPKVRYTERPDVAAVHLLEGHILVLVDTSPSAMILPVTYFHHLQHAEEYRQGPLLGGLLRAGRYFAVLMSMFLLPLWLLFSLNPELLPEQLKFIGPEETGNVPLFIQALLAELGINLMRIAAIHTPTSLATALGLIAAVLIGEIAVEIGLFAPEIILYTAVATVGIFATPSFELGLANTTVRLFLLLSTGLFGLPGFLGAALISFVFVALTKSFGVPYLWPLIPLNIKALFSILVRTPVPMQNIRLNISKNQDLDRQPSPAFKKNIGRNKKR
jgi:stage V sporulation protein AF